MSDFAACICPHLANHFYRSALCTVWERPEHRMEARHGGDRTEKCGSCFIGGLQSPPWPYLDTFLFTRRFHLLVHNFESCHPCLWIDLDQLVQKIHFDPPFLTDTIQDLGVFLRTQHRAQCCAINNFRFIPFLVLKPNTIHEGLMRPLRLTFRK